MIRRLWYIPAYIIFPIGYKLCGWGPLASRRWRLGKWLMYHGLMMCARTVKYPPFIHPEDEYEKRVDHLLPKP